MSHFSDPYNPFFRCDLSLEYKAATSIREMMQDGKSARGTAMYLSMLHEGSGCPDELEGIIHKAYYIARDSFHEGHEVANYISEVIANL